MSSSKQQITDDYNFKQTKISSKYNFKLNDNCCQKTKNFSKQELYTNNDFNPQTMGIENNLDKYFFPWKHLSILEDYAVFYVLLSNIDGQFCLITNLMLTAAIKQE